MSLFAPPAGDPVQAEASFERFVAAGRERLPWFVTEVTRLTGRRPRAAVEDLEWLTGVVVARLAEPGDATSPEWLTDAFRAEGWTGYGAALADGLVHLVAELYRFRLGAVWVLETDPRHANHLRPVLSVRGATPPWRLVPLLRQVRAGQATPDRIVHAVQTVLAGAGSPGPEALTVTVAASGQPDFDHELFVDESAEWVLGEESFAALAGRFATLPGVEEVLQEDREVFLVRAPGLSASALEAGARHVVGEAAR
jgi:hypothetical protein